RPRERLQSSPHAPERGLVEPGADLGDVDQAAILVHAEVERAEKPARALGIGPASDHELLPSVTLDLEPLAGTAAGVAAVHPLGEDALDPLLGGRLVERLAALGRVGARAGSHSR